MIHEFRVRWYQRRLHEALIKRTHERYLAFWHRRAGKDEIAMNAMRDISRDRVGTYWHCLPEFEQARKALWNAVSAHTGKNRVETVFPQSAGFKHDQQQMLVTMPWGSTWQLIGSDRYNATVGAGPVGIVYSEWALSNPSAYAYHKPMLRESKGIAAFITTPRGNNHAKAMLDNARRDPAWWWEILTAEDTGALTPEELAGELKEYQALWGIDLGRAYFEQEYLCSFAGAQIGAYFGAEMARAEREGRICDVPVDPAHPVHTAWDLGKAVNNPIWCFQIVNGALRVIDFYRPETDDVADWCDWLNNRGYDGDDYVPHDILATEWGTSRSRIEVLKANKRKPRRIPRLSVADGLQAGRMAINAAVFDVTRCDLGVEGLKAYRREWDDELKTFRENPVKDWAEHIGSAWRYLGLAYRDRQAAEKPPEKPKELTFTVRPDGTIQGNLGVREAVEAMRRRKRGE